MSFTRTFKEIGDAVSADDRQLLMERARDLRKAGMRNSDAEVKAAQELLSEAVIDLDRSERGV